MSEAIKRWWVGAKMITQHQIDRWHGSRDARDMVAVCESMLYLNSYAKTRMSHFKYPIYRIKNRVTRKLYRELVPTRVIREWQVLTCNRCNGTGQYFSRWNDDDICRRCDGSGIYNRVELFRFVFNVNGQRFEWHQPAGTVDFPVFVEDSDKVINGLIGGRYDDFDSHKAVRAMATVNAYLGRHAVSLGVYDIMPHVRQGWRVAKTEVRDFLRRAKYLPEPTWDDFPF